MARLDWMRFVIASLLLLCALPAQASDALFDAARGGSVPTIEALIAEGAPIESQTRRGYTPFILAAYHGHLAAARKLTALGADPCATDSAGSSALMGVAFKGHARLARWFITNTSCDVNHQNLSGQTALMMASLFGREAIIDALLAAGAIPAIVDAQGNTAESLARAQGLSGVVTKLRFVMQ